MMPRTCRKVLVQANNGLPCVGFGYCVEDQKITK